MISDPDIANQVSRLMLDIFRQVDESLSNVRERCPADELKAYQNAIFTTDDVTFFVGENGTGNLRHSTRRFHSETVWSHLAYPSQENRKRKLSRDPMTASVGANGHL
jgi:hypothetical protein